MLLLLPPAMIDTGAGDDGENSFHSMVAACALGGIVMVRRPTRLTVTCHAPAILLMHRENCYKLSRDFIAPLQRRAAGATDNSLLTLSYGRRHQPNMHEAHEY